MSGLFNAIVIRSLVSFLILASFSQAKAYPGAEADELQGVVYVYSICSNMRGRDLVTFAYGRDGVKPNAKGECPRDYTIRIESENGRYKIAFADRGVLRFDHAISEVRYALETAALQMATKTTPIAFSYNHFTRTVEKSQRIGTEKRVQTLALVAICKTKLETYLYSQAIAAGPCPFTYAMKLHRFLDQGTEPTWALTVVGENRSPLFTTPILNGVRTEIIGRMRDASAQRPLLMTFDARHLSLLDLTH